MDREFHNLIVGATGNKILIDAYESIEKKLSYLTAITESELSDYAVKNLIIIAQQHVALSSAIRNGFSTAARDLMNEHLNFCMNTNRKFFD